MKILAVKMQKRSNAFNERIKNDKRVEQVLLTVRDGLLLIRKKLTLKTAIRMKKNCFNS